MTLLRQVAIVAVGLVLAAAMVLLGRWQLDVYQDQGTNLALQRAAAPPVDLASVAPPNTVITDGVGRSVTFSGQYDATLQILIPIEGRPGSARILSGLRQPDGSIVPVIRGITDGTAPTPPGGTVSQTGVLLPSEDNEAERRTPAGQLDAVRLPLLAQRWTGPMVLGYVTLAAPDAQAQGLQPAPLNLPEARGRLRNAAYAFQWWLFAAFAVVMSVRIARDVRPDTDDALDVTPELPTNAT